MSGIQTTDGARVSPVRFLCRGHLALRHFHGVARRVVPLPPPSRNPPSAASRARGNFANFWQKRSKIAKHWQIHPPRGFLILPMFGKNGPNLPRLGKIGMETEAALHEVGAPQATGPTTLAKAWQNLPEVRHPVAPAFSLSGPLPLR